MTLYYKDIYIYTQDKISPWYKAAVRKYSLVKVQYSFGKSSKRILGLVLISNIKLLDDIFIQ